MNGGYYPPFFCSRFISVFRCPVSCFPFSPCFPVSVFSHFSHGSPSTFYSYFSLPGSCLGFLSRFSSLVPFLFLDSCSCPLPVAYSGFFSWLFFSLPGSLHSVPALFLAPRFLLHPIPGCLPRFPLLAAVLVSCPFSRSQIPALVFCSFSRLCFLAQPLPFSPLGCLSHSSHLFLLPCPGPRSVFHLYFVRTGFLFA